MVNLGQAMQAYPVPCWWVGWWLWRAGCISQDTYLLYFSTERQLKDHPVFDKCQSTLVLLQTLSTESDNVFSKGVFLNLAW